MSRHVAPPRSRYRIVVERNASGNDKETETGQPRFPCGRTKKGSQGLPVMKQMRLGCCYSKPASANE